MCSTAEKREQNKVISRNLCGSSVRLSTGLSSSCAELDYLWAAKEQGMQLTAKWRYLRWNDVRGIGFSNKTILFYIYYVFY
jgi:hypothetical protein